MAGRKNKYTVDYFPHYCRAESKTMFILENKYGLEGYAIWYKTLELFGQSEYHYIDLRDETDRLFLISKLGITEEKFNNIYDLLAKLGAIDLELWDNKIVFSDNFISNVEDAYVRRKGINVLHKYDLCKHLSIKCEQKLPKKRKENQSKEDNNVQFESFWDLYDKKMAKRKVHDKWKKLKEHEIEKIFATLPEFMKQFENDKTYQPHPITYLNQERWEDEIEKKPEVKKGMYEFYNPPKV